jgi:hypothetical protein
LLLLLFLLLLLSLFFAVTVAVVIAFAIAFVFWLSSFAAGGGPAVALPFYPQNFQLGSS